MSTWEYKVINTDKSLWTAKDKSDIESILNDLGRDSWELVSVAPLSHAGGSTTGLQLFLKRKRF